MKYVDGVPEHTVLDEVSSVLSEITPLLVRIQTLTADSARLSGVRTAMNKVRQGVLDALTAVEHTRKAVTPDGYIHDSEWPYPSVIPPALWRDIPGYTRNNLDTVVVSGSYWIRVGNLEAGALVNDPRWRSVLDFVQALAVQRSSVIRVRDVSVSRNTLVVNYEETAV